jgi:hypothetical protein
MGDAENGKTEMTRSMRTGSALPSKRQAKVPSMIAWQF